MSEINVTFTLDDVDIQIQTLPEDNMKDICQRFSDKIGKDINSLMFLYEGNQVNFNSSFKDKENSLDINKNEMKILVSVKKNASLPLSNTNIKENVVQSKHKNLLINNVSEFFIKILFSHLNEKIKLKAVKYNNNLKNKIDITLMNYKFFIWKYIEYEDKRKGKEHLYNGILIYEGEFLDGERSGKGKEYRDDYVKYEGEFLHGKRHGKG